MFKYVSRVLLMLCDCQFDPRMAREMKRGRREGGAGAEKNDEKNSKRPKKINKITLILHQGSLLIKRYIRLDK